MKFICPGHVHVTDFNIATVLEDGQLATSMSGTKPYIGTYEQRVFAIFPPTVCLPYELFHFDFRDSCVPSFLCAHTTDKRKQLCHRHRLQNQSISVLNLRNNPIA